MAALLAVACANVLTHGVAVLVDARTLDTASFLAEPGSGGGLRWTSCSAVSGQGSSPTKGVSAMAAFSFFFLRSVPMLDGLDQMLIYVLIAMFAVTVEPGGRAGMWIQVKKCRERRDEVD